MSLTQSDLNSTCSNCGNKKGWCHNLSEQTNWEWRCTLNRRS